MVMMRKYFIYFVIFYILSTPSNAQQIRVITEHFPPFQVSEEGQPIKGIAIELIRKLMSEVNIDAPIEVYPWARAYKLALEKPNVLIFSIARTKDRENLFHWVGSLGSLEGHIWTLKGNSHIKISTIDDANQYSIAVTREDSTHHYLKQNDFDKNLNLYLTTTSKQNIEMLFSKRIDLIIATDLMIEKHVKNSDLDYEQLKKVFTFEPKVFQLYIAFSKRTPLILVDRFKEALKKINKH